MRKKVVGNQRKVDFLLGFRVWVSIGGLRHPYREHRTQNTDSRCWGFKNIRFEHLERCP